MVVRPTAAQPSLAGGSVPSGSGRPETLVESYKRLAEVFHHVLSEQSLDALLDRIAGTLADLMPYEALHVYEADEERGELVPLLARSQWYEDEIMQDRPRFGEGMTGWAVENRQPVWTNRAHLDPRVVNVPGTPVEPEALITIPLVARGALKGALNIYRLGEDAAFYEHEFELAKWFGDAAALAMDNAQIRMRLEHLAQTDSLTGLYNHRYFHERLRAELTRASRFRDSIAVLMLDLDDFKRVNDIHGHSAGDQVLTQVARVARETVRASDIVCRIGGEEFAVIMPSCDAGGALGLAARLTERTPRSTSIRRSVTISIGVAQGPQHAASPRELISCAEAAMMTAKARGKNQAVLYDEDATERPRRRGHGRRDLRSIGHMKLLQSLAGKLNRLNDVQEIAATIATELRLLIDYHNCRIVLRDGDELRPIAFVGDFDARARPCGRRLHDDRRCGHHRPGRRVRRVAARPERARVRIRGPVPELRRDRRVARRGAAALRLAGHRGDRDLEAGARPVRRGRHPAARGARRTGVGRARECPALRPAAAGGPERQGPAGLPRRGLARAVVRRDLHEDGRDRGDALRVRSSRCGSRTVR